MEAPAGTKDGASGEDKPGVSPDASQGRVAIDLTRRSDGWAPIKAEFIRPKADEPKTVAERAGPDGSNGGAQGKRRGRGRNNRRPTDERPGQGKVLCPRLSVGEDCDFGDRCRFSHDAEAYLRTKGADLAPVCPVWEARGRCPLGLKCRFGSSHIDRETLKPIVRPGAQDAASSEAVNDLSRELQSKLRRGQVPFACDRKGFKAFLESLDAEHERSSSDVGVPQAAADDASGPSRTAQPVGAVPRPASPSKRVAEAVSAAGDDGGEEDASSPRAKRPRVAEDAGGATPGGDDGGKIVETDVVNGAEDSGEIQGAQTPMPLHGDNPDVAAGIVNAVPETNGAGEGDPAAKAEEDGGGDKDEVAKDGTSQDDAVTQDREGSGGSSPPAADVAGEKMGGVSRGGSGDVDDGAAWVRSCAEGAERRASRAVDFEGKVYVAPLTTVGNLPFRRVMKKFGADITCGEMALGHQVLKGHGAEWALLRRHSSEDVFGVQVAGAHPDQMTRLAQLLEENVKMDFVDINLGCPIDLVCDMGMGSALMKRGRKLKGIIAGMTSQLSCPLTVKMRVGWDEKKPNADKVVRVVQREAARSRARGFPGSVSYVMVHGRSRLQRYSKLADWEYVRKVAASQDPAEKPLRVIGNGDILSWRDHEERLEQAAANGLNNFSTCCMLARGALIKPWLPTEVKEKRDWDISASERLDIYKSFVNYGLEHWGCDQLGVNKTRRFLLEWLSFTHRYIPVGILEVLPQRINERPLPYYGRNDLEGLLGSQNAEDWIKISKMLLGPVPDDFQFEPKHKANSYAPQAVVTA